MLFLGKNYLKIYIKEEGDVMNNMISERVISNARKAKNCFGCAYLKLGIRVDHNHCDFDLLESSRGEKNCYRFLSIKESYEAEMKEYKEKIRKEKFLIKECIERINSIKKEQEEIRKAFEQKITNYKEIKKSLL